MNPIDSQFVHRQFQANEWESSVKTYIKELPITEKLVWYKRDRVFKKFSEELVTLGYYVKYRYGTKPSISFKLNESKEAADGWVYENNSVIESIQITIAYYDEEEVDEDQRRRRDRNYCRARRVYDRLKLLEERVENRVKKKTEKEYKEDIDVLLVGVQDWFVARLCTDYANLKSKLTQQVQTQLAGSIFRELAIVDTDLVGEGQLLLFPNEFRIRVG